MRLKFIFFAGLIFSVFTACSKSESDNENADKMLAHIKILISQNQLNKAKSEIDSVHALFPKLIDKRKIAVALKDTIILRESYKMRDYCNKVLPEMKRVFNDQTKNFVLIKDEKYEETGKYYHKSQLPEQNSSRNYLSVELADNGDVLLVSHYCGNKLNNSILSVKTLGVVMSPDSSNTNSGVLHLFSDGFSHFENLTYENKSAERIIDFIAANRNATIIVMLSGGRQYSYTLADKDKVAIVQTAEFVKAKKTITQLERELKLSLQRIGKINLLYN